MKKMIAGRAGFPVWRRQQQQQTDNNRQTTLADLVWGFFRPAAVRPVGVGLGIFPAGGGPAGRRWLGDFPDIRAVSAGSSGSSSAAHLYRTFFYRVPVVPHIFLSDSCCTAHFSIGFQLYRTFFYRIPVVPHMFL